jgi:hypothetical protein
MLTRLLCARCHSDPNVTAATPEPLYAWAGSHLDLSPAELAPIVICFNGVAATTGANLRSRPRAVYEAIYNQTSVADESEATHYMERLMAAAYGPAPTSANWPRPPGVALQIPPIVHVSTANQGPARATTSAIGAPIVAPGRADDSDRNLSWLWAARQRVDTESTAARNALLPS